MRGGGHVSWSRVDGRVVGSRGDVRGRLGAATIEHSEVQACLPADTADVVRSCLRFHEVGHAGLTETESFCRQAHWAVREAHSADAPA